MQLTKAAHTFKARFWEYIFDRYQQPFNYYNLHYKWKGMQIKQKNYLPILLTASALKINYIRAQEGY